MTLDFKKAIFCLTALLADEDRVTSRYSKGDWQLIVRDLDYCTSNKAPITMRIE